MLAYCLKCRNNTENVNSKLEIKNGALMLLSKCAICGSKKSRFIKKQEAKVLLSNLGIKIPILSKMPVLVNFLF